MPKIFISYKRVDKNKVFKIKDQIESALGEKCWIDLDGIESDAQFKNVIIKAINECEIVLFMYSKAHSKIVDFEKDWTVRELNFAQRRGKRIVFVNLDRSVLSDIFEFDYGTKQQVDGLSKESLNRLCEDLIKWLGIKCQNSEEDLKHSKHSNSKIEAPSKDVEITKQIEQDSATKKENDADEGCLVYSFMLLGIGLIILYPTVWLIPLFADGYKYPGLWSMGISWVIMISVGISRMGNDKSSDLRKSLELWILIIVATAIVYCVNYL